MAKTQNRMSAKRKVKKPAPKRRPGGDDLETYIADRTAKNPEFGRLMEEAAQRKRLLNELAAARRAAGLSQTVVAARMHTSTSAVARLEQGDANPTLSTLQRFASAIGKHVELRLADTSDQERDGAHRNALADELTRRAQRQKLDYA